MFWKGCDWNETLNQINVFVELKKYDDIAENSTGLKLEEIENSTKPAGQSCLKTHKGKILIL